jgi:hypothetical protein
VTFRSSYGKSYGPYPSMASTFDVVNLKVINFQIGGSPPFDEVGN